MSKTERLLVKDLTIDLNNFRTVTQKNEIEAINSMISINPTRFWGLMDSLLDTGYLPTENIIILEFCKKNKTEYLVKEGNRRIACLKMILGLIDAKLVDIPNNIKKRIDYLSKKWIANNSTVPCAIYPKSKSTLVDKIVNITHGKNEAAARDDWESVARARHNRKMNGAAELGLSLLETYLKNGTNITPAQKIQWAGKYNLTVLDSAISKIYPKIGLASSLELVENYPNIIDKKQLEVILYDIGMGILTFPILRGKEDFTIKYNFSSDIKKQTEPSFTTSSTPKSNTDTAIKPIDKKSNKLDPEINPSDSNKIPKQKRSTPINSQMTVRRLLKELKLSGTSRNKIVTVRDEMNKLILEQNPIAFCFLLRCIFELSAKAFCNDLKNKKSPNAPEYIKNDREKSLCDILRDITDYMTQNKKNKSMLKTLHGAMTEIAKSDGILSVTSMNQLVHNSSFIIAPSDIPIIFSNIYPLLKEMNE